MTKKNNHIKPIPNSEDAYARLKPITDAAQSGALNPWSPSVIDLLARYKVNVQRLEDVKAQANLSFPTSIADHRSMAIGFRYAKEDDSFAEDLFVFVEDVGLTCYYRGSQEDALPEYKGSHHAKIVLTELLPDFQRDMANMQQQINDIEARSARIVNTHNVEIITDEEFLTQRNRLREQAERDARQLMGRLPAGSAQQFGSQAVYDQINKKIQELTDKKARSDRFYELERQDITDASDKEYKDKQADLGRRNMLASGFGQQELEEIQDRRKREIEKLKLKYGKSS